MRRLILLAFAAVSVAASPMADILPDRESWIHRPAGERPATPPPFVKEVGPENFNLAGAGDLELNASSEDLAGFELDDWYTFGVDLDLEFDGSGAPLRCTVAPEETSQEAGQAACSIVMRSARFRFHRGFSIPVTRGQIRAGFWLEETVAPLRPVRFVSRGEGTLVGLGYYNFPNRPDERCSVHAGGLTESTEEQVCAAFLQTAEARRFRFSDGQPMDRRMESVKLWVAPDSRTVQRSANLRLVWDFGQETAQLRYPPDETPEALRLAPDQGRVTVITRPEDTLNLAFRNNIHGRSRVLVGVTAGGAIVSCRPLESAGAALLDNLSCRLINERGRFLFSSPGQPFEGVRYTTTTVRWEG